MLRSTFVRLLVLGCATAAAACSNGAGWYQVWETSDGTGVHAGPFANETACEATLPADTAERAYYCEHLDKAPD